MLKKILRWVILAFSIALITISIISLVKYFNRDSIADQLLSSTYEDGTVMSVEDSLINYPEKVQSLTNDLCSFGLWFAIVSLITTLTTLVYILLEIYDKKTEKEKINKYR